MNRKQLAKLFGVNTRTIRRWYGKQDSFDENWAKQSGKIIRLKKKISKTMKNIRESRKEIRNILFDSDNPFLQKKAKLTKET